MADEHLLRPRIGGAASYEAAQTDPNLSLGSFQSATTIAAYEGAVTGVNSDREIVDTGLPGTDFTGGWVVFLDTNNTEAREIIDHDTGTDTLTFAEVLPSTPVVTDRFWVFTKNGYFDACDADVCRRRATRHRLGFVKNEDSSLIDDVRIWIRDYDAGPLICEVAMATFAPLQAAHMDVTDIVDEEGEPIIGNTLSGFGNNKQDWKRPRSYALAVNSPYGSEGSPAEKTIRELASNVADRAFWVRLRFDPDSPIPLPSVAAFQIFVDNGVTTSSFMVVVDVDGVPETITPTVDRRLRIAGGARLNCIVLDSVEPFEPVPGRTITIELASGPGSVNAQSDTVQRDDGEPIRRVYVAPTDPADAGLSVQFDFEVT